MEDLGSATYRLVIKGERREIQTNGLQKPDFTRNLAAVEFCNQLVTESDDNSRTFSRNELLKLISIESRLSSGSATKCSISPGGSVKIASSSGC